MKTMFHCPNDRNVSLPSCVKSQMGIEAAVYLAPSQRLRSILCNTTPYSTSHTVFLQRRNARRLPNGRDALYMGKSHMGSSGIFSVQLVSKQSFNPLQSLQLPQTRWPHKKTMLVYCHRARLLTTSNMPMKRKSTTRTPHKDYSSHEASNTG